MASPTSVVERQIRRVRRRLFWQRLGWYLVVGWAGVLLLAALALVALNGAHFRSDPHPLESTAVTERALWVAAALGVALMGAVALALHRLPSFLDTALSIDRTFGLRERVTTTLTLGDNQETPIVQALVADTGGRVAKLDLREGYPHRISAWTALVPTGAALFVAAALFCEPPPAGAGDEDPAAQAQQERQQTEAVAHQLEQLKKDKPKPGDRPTTPEMEDLDAEWNRIADKKPETREEARQAVNELTDLADRMRKREQELVERHNAMREQAEQMDRLRKREQQKGPADQMQKALSEADFKKAEDEARDLSRKMEEDKLSKEEREQLKKQLDELKDKLQSMADEDRRKKELEELKEKGELTQEQFEREMKQLEENLEEIDQETRDKLKELAQKLDKVKEELDDEKKKGECAKCMNEAADKLKELDKGGTQKELGDRLEKLTQAQIQLQQALNPQPVPGAGARPQGKEELSKGKDTQIKGEMTPGKVTGVQQVPGQGRKGQPTRPADVPALVDAAQKETAEALERQNLQKGDGDLARGYYERLNKAGQPQKK